MKRKKGRDADEPFPFPGSGFICAHCAHCNRENCGSCHRRAEYDTVEQGWKCEECGLASQSPRKAAESDFATEFRNRGNPKGKATLEQKDATGEQSGGMGAVAEANKAGSRLVEEMNKKKQSKAAEERKRKAMESRRGKLALVKKAPGGMMSFKQELLDLEQAKQQAAEEALEESDEREIELRAHQVALLETRARKEAQIEYLKLQVSPRESIITIYGHI